MPGEFVVSPRYPFHNQLIGFSKSQTQVQGSKDGMTKKMDLGQQQGRTSLESIDSVALQKQSAESSQSKSGIRSALDKARHTFSSSGKDQQVLDGSEEEFEKQKQREIEFKKRQGEYASFGLKDKSKFSGGMQMSG